MGGYLNGISVIFVVHWRAGGRADINHGLEGLVRGTVPSGSTPGCPSTFSVSVPARPTPLALLQASVAAPESIIFEVRLGLRSCSARAPSARALRPLNALVVISEHRLTFSRYSP